MAYFEIGIYAPIRSENIGTLWRSAYQLGAAGIFIIGSPPRNQASDTTKTRNEIPLRIFPTWEDFLTHRPIGGRIVAVEMGGIPLATYEHPSNALYVLGSEANGLPQHVLDQCDHQISIETVRSQSFNVAVAGSIVMYHRIFLSII
jgi:tRNA G18 (ribose-2'-O)-methylase SpoU